MNEKSRIWGGALLGAALALGLTIPGRLEGGDMALKRSDVVFMYASDDDAYKAYGATFVGWGGANTKEEVERHHRLGIRCTGSMWCLTAGAQIIHDDPNLRAACAVDIEGVPIEVPWLFDHTVEGTKSYFGCTNSPEFRALCEQRVRECMAGGADGLHVDDHLGVASPAWWHGGGLCDHCIEAFRGYLSGHATEAQLKQAGVGDLNTFDYRDLIRQHATTRDEYKKVQREIPLMDLFLEFHAQAAADHVKHLGEVAAEAAGHPVMLSANAGLPNVLHTYVLPRLTHVICEVDQKAPSGTSSLSHAIEAYATAEKFGKPMAATASGWDWAYVKEHNCEDLVRFWIALAYAHGQRFMAPHPTKQWCFNNKLGTHWYEAPVESFAPLYRFVRAQAQWFDEFEGVNEEGMVVPDGVMVKARRRGQEGTVVLHVINKDYDAEAKRIRPKQDVALELPGSLAPKKCKTAIVCSYDAEPLEIKVKQEGRTRRLILPKLGIWSLVILK